ncbi:hypothetical protein SteCoe_21602 [Stentor coeruleus]|uniref:Uncharacterized protein n=1 Tax=Stentor coeruleus TaxID=5963 RepID=A0A1R2BP63_9CILI|nr:hypothetical protein SteCoe_21602 [Stentor coeruleus]
MNNFSSKFVLGDRDPLYFHEYSMRWLEERNRKVEETRKIEMEKESVFSPIKRADTPPGYKSLITDWESRVSEYYEKKNKNIDIYTHTPEINSTSRAMLPVWNEKVENRLNRMNVEKKEKIEELRKKAEQAEVPSFTPLTNPSKKPRPEDVGSYLYQEGITMIDKRKKAAEVCKFNEFTFKPVINEASRTLAINRKPKVKVEPHVEPQAPSRVLKPEEFENFLERNYIVNHDNFGIKNGQDDRNRPKIPEKSDESSSTTPRRGRKTVVIGNLYEKEMKRINDKEQKRKEILRERRTRELDGCTFQPKINTRAKTPPPYSNPDIKQSKVFKYNKNPKTLREYWRYEDDNHKFYQLKAFYYADKGFINRLEELEKRVIEVIK